jgi:hypothetical protein
MIRIVLIAAVAAAAARAGENDGAPGRAAFPSNGVDEAPRRGTFAEAGFGAFATLGGSRRVSGAQPYLGLTVGRDLGSAASLFVSVGTGASSGSCFQMAAQGCAGTDSFGATFVELGASYGTWMSRRVLLSGKLVGGATLFSPGPFTRDAAVPDRSTAPHAGAGVGLDYDTRLSHFAVGLDAMLRYSLAARPDTGGRQGIASLTLMPRIRYVF